MKYNIFSVLFCLLLSAATFAQSASINTASASYTTYMSIEKVIKKTESLDKAKNAIDDAIEVIREKQAADDSKLKSKVVAKGFHYYAAVYAEIAALDNHPANQGSSKIAMDAVKASMEADEKGSYSDQNLKVLDFIRALYYNDGISSFQAKEYEKGLTNFKTSLELTDMINASSDQEIVDTSAIVMSAYCAQNGQNFEDAIKYYEQAVELDYDDENMYLSLNQLYAAKEESEKAKAILEAGKKRYGPEKFMIAEINSLLKEDKNDEAVALMQEAVSNEAYSKNASLLFALGAAFEGLEVEGNKDKALEYYGKALALNPELFDAIYNTGALYYNMAVANITAANDLPLSKQKEYDGLKKAAEANFNQALPFFDKALEVKADDMNTLIALKEIHAQLGDMVKSKEYKERYEALQSGGE
ncbi:MAG: hypothetical protein ACPGVB_03935 [Chitinophagales bacterium]